MYKGTKVVLRAYGPADAEIAHRLFNRHELHRLLNPDAIYPVSLEEEREFVTGAAKK